MFENGNSTVITVKNLMNQLTEIFMLSGSILSDEETFIYNSMTWYITVYLIVGYVLWFGMKNYKDVLLTLAPVIVFWIYAYMCYAIGTTNNWRTHVFEVLNYGTLRGIAGMLLGCIVYKGNGALKQPWRSHRWKYMNGVVLLIIPFILSYFWFGRASFLYVMCFAYGIMLIVAAEPQIMKIPRAVRMLSAMCSKINYAIYLNHYFMIRILMYTVYPKYSNDMVPIYLCLLILYSIFTSWLISALMKKLRCIMCSQFFIEFE